MASARKTRRARNQNRTGIISRVWGPFGHFFSASGESAKQVGTTAGSVVQQTLYAVKGVGNTFARHANMAVRGVTKRRKSRGKRSKA